ncbi:hypothetical protein FJT64_027891 [Amphibalanus amphitrite]|uniref:Uncharacterized protein n=1 Tax=Amphibalanus amphitrite TaxID=1232801 RepID=A0A6A4WBP6_AMPAM|nr:hypothetical protein FJT64_027891 [Amphibalanus amphitrite]
MATLSFSCGANEPPSLEKTAADGFRAARCLFESMALYVRKAKDYPSWEYSLANTTAELECTCVLRCLADDRCASVLIYPIETTAHADHFFKHFLHDYHREL